MVVKIECDMCRKNIRDGDDIFCEQCYKEMQKTVDSLTEKNDELRNRLKKIEQGAASHLEVDPITGEYRPKVKPVTPEFPPPTTH